jgi:DNA-binding NtrC family response regulator
MVPLNACSALPILLVDDEASFRTSFAETLRDDGHTVLDYATPAEVPPLESLGHVALLVTDYEMPGMTGIQLADAFHAHHPRLPVLVVTAYRTEAVDAQIGDRAFVRLFHKPVDYDAIHQLIHELADRTLRP